MKCPLVAIAMSPSQTPRTPQAGDCLEAGCAWWDMDSNQCSVTRIKRCLAALVQDLHFIAHRSPPAPSSR